MYLKLLEMSGFKSFANKTKLQFEPGMTAIVGPNGCGKSNVSDAVRWVLGEQSAKALRGSSMEDCIFNGTDSRKPVGLAEVNITFADCEGMLETEFHEVTVTRRVDRSGAGQYYINKTACRLKDIQRLFMGTGIGTTSYSLMEQGRIDRILSARPEDRRAVFEEASGITKFKADKKEAIRKLEHTEANLLRLSDVIREVKRQIGSLQRQAGKARRYKAYREEMRSLDVFATRERLKEADREIRAIAQNIARHDGGIRAARNEVDEMEEGNRSMRESLMRTEREIGGFMEAGVQAQSRLDHTHELIRMNRQRIGEYRALSERDGREIETLRGQIEEHRNLLGEQAERVQAAEAQRTEAESELRRAAEALESRRRETDAVREQVEKLRADAVELESAASHLQNEMVRHESQERSTVLQRERLTSEKSQLARTVETFAGRREEMAAELASLREKATEAESRLGELLRRKEEKEQEIARLREKGAEAQSRAAARRARIEMLREDEAARDDFPGGTRMLLDESKSMEAGASAVLGALAAHVQAEPEFTAALETALRAWLDAVLVADAEAAHAVLRRLEDARKGPARILAIDAASDKSPPTAPDGAVRLIDHVRFSNDGAKAVVQSLIGHVLVVERAADLPVRPHDDRTYVSRAGSSVRPDGRAEFWMAETGNANPLSRRHMLAEAESSLARDESELQALSASVCRLDDAIRELGQQIREAQDRTDRARLSAAQKEGESQVVGREAEEAGKRLETVTWELDDITARQASGEDEKHSILNRLDEVRSQREEVVKDIGARTKALEQLESEQSALQSETTEARIRFAALDQNLEHLGSQHANVRLRVEEMEGAMGGRSEGIRAYAANIESLEGEVAELERKLTDLEEAVKAHGERAESLRRNREKQSEELKQMETALGRKRTELDGLREKKSAMDIRLSECRLRRQNQIDRLASDYGMTPEQITEAPTPEWKDKPPTLEQLETSVAELRTKLEGMGPVNLVAIEEYEELQQRYEFLSTQEQDLTKSKQQLMDMIRKINKTTSEMFQTTFNQVNANFQETFKKLFNGGSARLVMVDEEDVLESGIEIIARPPGKRLQNVSLLSGGERTLTAVALLFAIYMIKPSPFCMLDELDAALDDSNIGRFVNILQGFLDQSQFVVITHNRQTIAAADVLYGVTMPERGVSDVVSMKFKEAEALAEA